MSLQDKRLNHHAEAGSLPTPHELALMRSLQALDHTIRHLCKERDALAAQLPKRPVPRMGKQLDGVEIRRKR